MTVGFLNRREKRPELMFGKCMILGLCLAGSSTLAQSGDRLALGLLPTGTTVSAIRAAGGDWGVEITGAALPSIRQPQPAKLEIFRAEEDIRQLAAGYNTVEKSADGFDAWAEIAYGQNVVFRVRDHWSLNGVVLSLRRKVEVAERAGRFSFVHRIHR